MGKIAHWWAVHWVWPGKNQFSQLRTDMQIGISLSRNPTATEQKHRFSESNWIADLWICELISEYLTQCKSCQSFQLLHMDHRHKNLQRNLNSPAALIWQRDWVLVQNGFGFWIFRMNFVPLWMNMVVSHTIKNWRSQYICHTVENQSRNKLY